MKFKMQVNVIGLLLAFVLMACSNPAPPSVSQNETKSEAVVNAAASQKANAVETKIIFLGDSLTAGYGLPTQQAWPEQVQKRLKSAGYNIQIINAGVSGDNTANGLARYDWSVGSVDADMLVLALGANDFLQGVSPQTMRQNLEAIIKRAQADDLTIILAGIQASNIETLGPRGAAYASVYPDLAKDYNLSYFPSMLEGVSGNPELLQNDGLHPTRAGVEVMADRFALHIGEILDK